MVLLILVHRSRVLFAPKHVLPLVLYRLDGKPLVYMPMLYHRSLAVGWLLTSYIGA